MRFKSFSISVVILSKCVTNTDYEYAKRAFENKYKTITNENDIRLMKKYLFKVGLVFNNINYQLKIKEYSNRLQWSTD